MLFIVVTWIEGRLQMGVLNHLGMRTHIIGGPPLPITTQLLCVTVGGELL